MADPSSRERLLPYLIDRLTDDQPNARQESLTGRTWSLRQAHAAVLRDLGWLLNTTRRPSIANLDEYPEAAKSVLNYGLPDLCGLTASGISARQLETALKTAIVQFEPRVMKNTLTIRTVQSDDSGRPNAVGLEIKGEIWASPMPDSLFVKTEVDLESGHCELHDRGSG